MSSVSALTLRITFALLCSISAMDKVFAQPPQNRMAIVVVDQVDVLSKPGGSEGAAVQQYVYPKKKRGHASEMPWKIPLKLSAGERVRLLNDTRQTPTGRWQRIQTSQYCDRDSLCEGWVVADSVSTPKQFSIITRWTGPTEIYIEAGDFAGTYDFKANGYFVLRGEYKGQLYRNGSVIFARKNGTTDFGNIFVEVPNKGLCWTDDREQCAR